MFKGKKSIVMSLAFLLLFLIIAGCNSSSNNESSGSNTGSDTNSDEGSGSSSKSEEVVELTYWDADWNESIAPEVIDEFEAANPNIKVNVEFFSIDGMFDKYLISLRSGNGPDLVNIAADWTTPFAAVGGLLQLDDYIESDNVDLNDFWEGALSTVKVNDGIYGLPYRSETHGLYYNADMLEQSGITAPPETWNDVLEAAKLMQENGNNGIALVGDQSGNLSYQVINFIRSFGGSVLNEDNTKSLLHEPKALEAAQYYVDLYKKHQVTPQSTMDNDNTDNRNLFSAGEAAMFFSGNYDIQPIKDSSPDLNFKTALFPHKEGEDKGVILGGWNIAATSFSEHPEAAWKFVNFIASAETSVKYSNTFSSRKSALENPKYQDELVKPFGEMLQHGKPLTPIPQMGQIRNIIFNRIQAAMVGDATVEESMKAASEEIDALLQE
ncbi:sugar ABC transporter substrate-binding protein [Gracilibacillus sp. YIM 98692]|uniref:ABC transporter substrate-binding protein n=1 Tax=Gracilibacillus sp. YIM 98692 TaxID=2663532 RepID=UPI0013D01291|nr:sugar ABC transporter substrate-binding protein [Gracilibacillus sp. YIM 98692]